MVNKQWQLYKKDMDISVPDYCSEIHEDDGTLHLKFSATNQGARRIQRAQVDVYFNVDHVFEMRKRMVINSNYIYGDIELSKGWIFVAEESELIDSLKKSFLYEEDENSYYHYKFVTDAEIIDVIATRRPGVMEWISPKERTFVEEEEKDK